MSRWGRAAVGAVGTAEIPARHLARRSILCAVIAYVVAAAVVVVAFRMPADMTLPWPTLAPLALGILFAVVVPLILVAGIVYGARALLRPGEGRAAAILGIILNLVSIGGVLVALWAMMAPQVG